MLRLITKSLFVLFMMVMLGGLLTLSAQPSSPTTPPSQPQACSQLVELAIKTTSDNCMTTTGRNQACYGNRLVHAEPQPAAQLNFTEVGHRADLVALKALDLGGLDLLTREWGVALMQVQANLPDTLPGQNVTFLLFGDVQLENRTPNFEPHPMRVAQGVNVRLTPTQDGLLLGSLRPGVWIDALGQHTQPDGTRWIQFAYDAHPGLTGWVINSGLAADDTPLPEVSPESQIRNPMQAIYFTTGVGKPLCVDAPPDGMLIQSPKGTRMVEFTLNGVRVQMGSTAFIQAVPNDALYFTLLEGNAALEANYVAQQVLPGQTSRIPLDANGVANGSPSFPLPYTPSNLQPLLDLLEILPAPISQLPPPVTLTPQPPQATAFSPSATPQLVLANQENTQETEIIPTQIATEETTITPPPCAFEEIELVSVIFRNTNASGNDLTGTTYDIYLKNRQCEDKFKAELAPGEAILFSTYVSRIWVIYNHETGELVKTWQAEVGGNYEVILSEPTDAK